ncbi:MAG TPA: hypothetical protein H9924_00430 [Candidatus Phocaeicola merdavium]|nr:hypothetical protein [Candidatus Phocaeicola merdavium]
MNKIFKHSFIALSLVLTLGFSACTEEVEYTPATQVDSNCIKASFASNDNFYELAPDESKELTLTVVRENTDGDVTIPLTVLRNDENMFQIPESVTFATGQNTATFNITFPNVEIGLEYTFSIGLDEADVDPYSQATLATTTGTVQMIQWDLLGDGSLTCTLLEDDCPCKVYKASHTSWYKAEAPVEEGMDIVFKVAEDNSVVVEDQPIFTHASYGTVYVNNEAGGGAFDPENNIIQAAFYYYCSAGTFGTLVETLTLPAVN